jgi:hypothetical protein
MDQDHRPDAFSEDASQAVRQIDEEEYRRLGLRAHSLLFDVDVHDIWAVDLPGGGDKGIEFVRSFFAPSRMITTNVVVRVLFEFRSWLGRVFRWDTSPPSTHSESFASRVTDADRKRSLVEPGARDGPFQLLYVFPEEAVSEVINATVHAFTVLALFPRGDGYRVYWAVHVKPTSGMTRYYMKLIEPFRRYLIYPPVLRQIRSAWERMHVG